MLWVMACGVIPLLLLEGLVAELLRPELLRAMPVRIGMRICMHKDGRTTKGMHMCTSMCMDMCMDMCTDRCMKTIPIQPKRERS